MSKNGKKRVPPAALGVKLQDFENIQKHPLIVEINTISSPKSEYPCLRAQWQGYYRDT